MPTTTRAKYGKAGPPPTKPAPTLKGTRLALTAKAIKKARAGPLVMVTEADVDAAELTKLTKLAADCNSAILRADARGGHTTSLEAREEIITSLLSYVTATRDEMLVALAKGGKEGKEEAERIMRASLDSVRV